MRALVSGATGFVGSAVARTLVADGWKVRALVRAASDRRNLEGLGLELAVGDLCNVHSLEAAVDACDAVFHVAADYRLWAPDSRALYRTNIEGTQNLLVAARRARVRRIVYTSSVATLGLRDDGQPADENTPVSLADMIGHYKRSKFLAERWVRESARMGLPVVIVNPSTPIGPCDGKPTPTGRVVLDAAAGRTPAYVDTGLNIVHVDDVAHGHLLAFRHGRIGERYVLGGEDMTLREMLVEIAEIVGRRPPRVRLPHALVLPLAFVAETLARIRGGETRITVDGVRMARHCMYFSSAKAQRELGYHWRPPRVALEDAVEWFRTRGLLPGVWPLSRTGRVVPDRETARSPERAAGAPVAHHKDSGGARSR
jgi:dihydroflavonol-4-reductase